MKISRIHAFALVSLLVAHGGAAQAQNADPALVDQGRYLVTAGDCAGCHGGNLAGGDPVPSPIGKIYAANITPDPATGIGGWTLDQFSDLMRKGQSPSYHIYPAMPYTSYTGMTDANIRALYSYLMLDVDPVSNEPPQTDLPFPFYRPMMAVWDMLFLDEGAAVGAVAVTGAQEERGRVLVETLGHCTTCHTPRGEMMQQQSDRHLGGALVNGWWAPNITPHYSGIGIWSDAQLATFLVTGHTDIAVAAGEMGTVVSRSLSRLPAEDIDAIVAYLRRAVPPVASDRAAAPANVVATPIEVAAIEPADNIGWQALTGHDTTDGAILYQGACASCHGVDGTGSTNLEHPSLRRINSVTGPKGETLVQVIAQGVDRRVGDSHTFMPGFRDSMDDAQIATLANYVRSTFGGVESDLDATQVPTILKGQVATPWLIRNAAWLAIAGLVIAALVLLAIIWALVRAVTRRRAGAA